MTLDHWACVYWMEIFHYRALMKLLIHDPCRWLFAQCNHIANISATWCKGGARINHRFKFANTRRQAILHGMLVHISAKVVQLLVTMTEAIYPSQDGSSKRNRTNADSATFYVDSCVAHIYCLIFLMMLLTVADHLPAVRYNRGALSLCFLVLSLCFFDRWENFTNPLPYCTLQTRLAFKPQTRFRSKSSTQN